MKRRFTILTAALALLTFLAVPMGMWGQASVGTTLWSEDFSGYSNNTVPSGSITNSHTGTTVYGGVTLTYACTNGGSTTQTYTSGGPNSNSNLLISKNGGSFTISGISTGEASELTVTYAKSGSGNVTISSSTEGVTIGGSTSGSTITTGGASTISITFTNSTSSNLRFDDAEITVKTAGGGQQLTTSDLALVDAPVELEFDLYDNANAQTVSYTTSSTGAVTVSQSNYITATVNANNTITVTPVAVTNGPQTITVNQAADNTYAAGSVTFTVDIEDTTPTTGSDVTFLAGTDLGSTSSNNSPDEMVKSGVTVYCTDAAFATAQYRLYKNSVTTISVESGTITNIVFNGQSTSYPVSGLSVNGNNGSFTVNNNVGTWTGNADEVSFSASGQARLSSIVVTVETSGTPEPTISTDDVNITYDATSGSIAYTISNVPSPVGTLTAAVTEGNWLTLGQGTTSPIAFTCTANENTTARTATVTLTYTYGDNETVTKDVTITQAEAPMIYTTIPALFDAATSTATDVIVTFGGWVVSAVHNSNAYLTDNQGHGLIIYASEHGFQVNDVLTGTASCKLQTYRGSAELTNLTSSTEGLTVVNNGTVTEQNIAISELGGVNTGALLAYQGLTYDGTALVDGNNNTITPYNTLYSYTFENGKTYNVKGVYLQYNSTKEILPRSAADIVKVVIVEPSITVDPDEVSVDAEEHDGTLDLTYENLTITEMGDFDIQYYDAVGTETSEPDWIEVLVAEQDLEIGEGYVVSYYMVENEGTEARTAYFKVFALGDEDYVYSNLVTITQAAPVAPVTGDKYVKVTSTDDLTSGQYLIVYEEGSLAFDGGLETLDAVGNTIEVTISNNEIVVNTTTTASEFSIDVTAGTIMSASGYYIGQTSNANGMQTSLETAYTNTISFDESGNANIVSSGGAYLRYNSASNQNRFRYYKSSSYTGQKAIQLYKKVVEPATESYTLTINGYTDVAEGEGTNNKGYYLIASPVTVDPATAGMTTGNFDLYYFDQNGTEGKEWRNYEDASFDLVPGTGYLYAKEGANQTFNFTLTGVPYDGDGEIELTNTTGAEFEGWNLVGNPFGVEAEISCDYFEMNSDGNEIIANEDYYVDAMQGVFVRYADAGSSVIFEPITTGTNTNEDKKVVLNLTRNRGNVIDRAIVRFGEGGQLSKFQLNPDNTKIYITAGNQDFAVVRSNNAGEMPVSFKAAENGNYTLSVEAENVEASYLHLIDNMTGADVDLLATPSYSFEARTTDYANRFRLVFNANGVNENNATASFAYFNGSSWTVSNMGEATLQVVDMMGRVVSTQAISGNTDINLNQVPGVYMLRLVNGENVMVQKVVVR